MLFKSSVVFRSVTFADEATNLRNFCSYKRVQLSQSGGKQDITVFVNGANLDFLSFFSVKKIFYSV